MSFLDRILSLFKTRSNDSNVSSRSIEPAAQNTSSVATNQPFKIHTIVRLDGMTFSTDYKTFYLIDAGRLIEFPLDTSSGLIIGELFGVLTFAARVRPAEGASEDDSSDNTIPTFIQNGETAAAAAEIKLVLPVEKGTFAPQFIPTEKTISIMGAGELDPFIDGGDPEDISPRIILIRTSGNRITMKFNELDKNIEIVTSNVFESNEKQNKEETI